MSWIIACKEYQKQTGSDKYRIPKKGTAEYDAVKKIFDGLPKAEKKEKIVKPKVKKEVVKPQEEVMEVMEVPLKKVKQKRKSKLVDPVSDDIRAKIRAELLAELEASQSSG